MDVILAQTEIPSGVQIEVAGTLKDQEEAFELQYAFNCIYIGVYCACVSV